MESDKVEKLLEKYFEATATVAEEAALRDYFSGDDIAVELERYAPMFRYFEDVRAEQSTRPLQLEPGLARSIGSEAVSPAPAPSKPERTNLAQSGSPTDIASKKLWYTWGSVAAMVLIMLGVYFSFDMADTRLPSESHYAQLQDEYTQEEIATAQEALALFSTKFSEGTEQLSHLNEFEKNTNRFLNEKQ